MNMNANLLVSHVWPVTGLGRAAILAVLGSALVAIAAQINVPMLPVPMTLQTLAVLAVGAAYGSRLGAATLALYALEGAAGLPVFAEMSAGIMRPSGGYVIGFILAAGLVGWLVERGWGQNAFKLFGAMLLGAAVLYVPGLIWLSTYVGGMEKAVEYGLTPFIIGDIVKAAIAALVFPAAFMVLGKR